jgi:hypothetical protein
LPHQLYFLFVLVVNHLFLMQIKTWQVSLPGFANVFVFN